MPPWKTCESWTTRQEGRESRHLRAGRLLIRVGVVGAVLLLADLAYTPVAHRPRVQALASGVADTTAFMKRATRTGHPVRHFARTPLASIAPVAACAVVLAEDEEFFDKGTVSWRAQRVLAQRMLRGDFTRGGSGLSQQLARNLFLTGDRTPRRKAREYLLAYELSHELPKTRLLEVYLNVVEFGDGIWGIEAASQRYFGVSAAALTASQAIVLASFLPAPRRELRYVLGGMARDRQDAIARKLWKSRLLTDRDLSATLDRLREWRANARAAGDAREGWARAERLLGEEAPSFVASPSTPHALPLARLCDPRRRGL